MITFLTYAARARAAGLLLFGLGLVGCASTPHPGAPTKAEPPAATDSGRMAPIPNPPERERPREPLRELRGGAAASSPQASASKATPAKSAAAKSAPEADPVRAARLREVGLEHLNRGEINRAVALLQQASQLDPANALIRRDLERAIRISRAVNAPGKR